MLKRLERYRKRLDSFLLYTSLLASVTILFHTGFREHTYRAAIFDQGILILFYSYLLVVWVKFGVGLIIWKSWKKINYGELFLCLYFFAVAADRQLHVIGSVFDPGWLYAGVFGVFIVELSKNALFIDKYNFNPTLLFVISFLLMILIGTVLLMLPKVTLGAPLSFVDALFMSTSAVCITGLSVVDIPAQITLFGQTILLILVQLGGLGMMTFTGFFGYFFSGGFSYKNQVMYTELLGEEKLGSVINTLLRIIIITFTFEAIGAVLIFYLAPGNFFSDLPDRLFFAVFHSVSAFCNAGFSNIPDGFHHPSMRFNYPMHLVLSVLFILGGLGFALVFNFYSFLKRWAKNLKLRVLKGKRFNHKAWVINFNSRLILWTTLFLLIFSTGMFLLLEYDRSLGIHKSFGGKLTEAFFMGATTRSAGLHTIDSSLMGFPVILVFLLLMWIGASPGSTGGGIKTTTFAVAALNLISIIKGKNKVEIFKREVSNQSLQRAFAVILLSLLGIGLSIFALSLTDGGLGLQSIAYECFSAYNTVGLSFGITENLSHAGRLVLVVSMFVGRVGALTLLLSFVNKGVIHNYQYPKEEVLF